MIPRGPETGGGFPLTTLRVKPLRRVNQEPRFQPGRRFDLRKTRG